MARTDNPVLAVVDCEACGGEAGIKKRKNGKKLLYLHCENCGCDQRGGKVIQAKWQSHIDDPKTETQTEQATENKTEWQPSQETKQLMSGDIENETDENSTGSTESNKPEPIESRRSGWGFGGLIICAIIGIRAFS